MGFTGFYWVFTGGGVDYPQIGKPCNRRRTGRPANGTAIDNNNKKKEPNKGESSWNICHAVRGAASSFPLSFLLYLFFLLLSLSLSLSLFFCWFRLRRRRRRATTKCAPFSFSFFFLFYFWHRNEERHLPTGPKRSPDDDLKKKNKRRRLAPKAKKNKEFFFCSHAIETRCRTRSGRSIQKKRKKNHFS